MKQVNDYELAVVLVIDGMKIYDGGCPSSGPRPVLYRLSQELVHVVSNKPHSCILY